METIMSAEQFRKQRREANESFSQIIDAYYASFYEVAKALKESGLEGSKIETPFGDFLITPKLFLK